MSAAQGTAAQGTAVTVEKEPKKKTEVTVVKMEDGRTVEFPGKRKLQKEYLIDEAKVETDGSLLQLQAGAVKVRFDFLNGATRTYDLPLTLICQFAGHGGIQKGGDELATPADKPLSPDDMVEAVDDLFARIAKGEWSVAREGGGGISGASVVLKAFLEALNDRMDKAGKPPKDMQFVKDYMQGKLDTAKAKGEVLSRKELYDSFRNPQTTVGKIIDRMEKEKLSKESKVDADQELADLSV